MYLKKSIVVYTVYCIEFNSICICCSHAAERYFTRSRRLVSNTLPNRYRYKKKTEIFRYDTVSNI